MTNSKTTEQKILTANGATKSHLDSSHVRLDFGAVREPLVLSLVEYAAWLEMEEMTSIF